MVLINFADCWCVNAYMVVAISYHSAAKLENHEKTAATSAH